MHLAVNCPRNSKIALNFSRPSGSKVMDQDNQNNILTNNSRTVRHTSILMPYQKTLLLHFIKSVDTCEIEHKTCQFLVRGAVRH